MRKVEFHGVWLVLAASACSMLYAQDEPPGTVQTWYGGGNGEEVVRMGVWSFDLFSAEQQDTPQNCDNTTFNPPGDLLFEQGWTTIDPLMARIEMLDPLEFPMNFDEVGGGVMRFNIKGKDSILPLQLSIMESPRFPMEDPELDLLYPEIVFHAQSPSDSPTLFYLVQCRIFDPDGNPMGGRSQINLPVEEGMHTIRVPFPELKLLPGMQVQIGVGVANQSDEKVPNKGPAIDNVKIEFKKPEERAWKFVPDIKQEGATCQGTAFANCLSWWANNGYPELAKGETQEEKNENLRKALVKLCHEDEMWDAGPSKYLKEKGSKEGTTPPRGTPENRPQLQHRRASGGLATWAKLQEYFDAGGDVLLRLAYYKEDGTLIPDAAHYVTVSRVEKKPMKRIRAANPWGESHHTVNNENKDEAYATFVATVSEDGKIRLDNNEIETRTRGVEDCEYLCVTDINVIRKVPQDGQFADNTPYIEVASTPLPGGLVEYEYTVVNTTSRDIEFLGVMFEVPVEDADSPDSWSSAELPAPYPNAEGCGDRLGGAGFAWYASDPIPPGGAKGGFTVKTLAGFPLDEIGVMAYTEGEGDGVFILGKGPVPRFGDLDGDGKVNGADLGLMLANWGSPGIGDLDDNGLVDGADLGSLLAAWTG
ncbi:MAG: hypothetical protein MK085_13435 [Phycisphaerales bacterium]|nr:hypothetical protein [Phycisphaerales bacterium]